jgi:hypothetical protein
MGQKKPARILSSSGLSFTYRSESNPTRSVIPAPLIGVYCISAMRLIGIYSYLSLR